MFKLSHIPFIVTIVLYFTSTVWSIGSIVYPHFFNKKVAKWTMMMGFFVHSGFLVFLGLESGNIPITNVYESFISLLWCVLFVYINLDYLYKLPSLDTFLVPLVTALSIWAMTFDGGNLAVTVSLKSFWLVAHIIPIFVGYAAFTVSFSLSIMYLTQQRQLKLKLFGALFNKLPSLEGIDKLMWKTLSLGFPLLTRACFRRFLGQDSKHPGGNVVSGLQGYSGIGHVAYLCGFVTHEAGCFFSRHKSRLYDYRGFLSGAFYLYRHLFYGIEARLSKNK